MHRLDGLDERALVFDDGWLDVTRWGASTHRFRVSDLGETEIVRDDKKGRFGKAGEEHIRVRFGGAATAIWVPAAQEDTVRAFAAAVDAARDRAS